MIPMKYLSKIGTYEVDFQGAKVKAFLVTNEAILEGKIAELNSSLQRQKCSVVGIDFKLCTDASVCFVGNGIRDKLPSSTLVHELCRIPTLPSLLFGTSQHTHEKPLSISLSGVVEACDLASMVLKKSNLCDSGLAELNKEVRINTVACTTASSSSCQPSPVSKVKVEKANIPVITYPNWSAVGFSDEGIEYAIHDAYTSCFIGDRLLGMLDAST
ncbi:hypothetical protein Ddye_028080 [Dipteronia dyeriana]|uniref:Uncharacterized protein n=1 Tax=Dipteronia dyeriana TaxID=168575 RepID=A0AAD9TR79_9ROSI|nr:hypothetical protein Ddye_028080 [Dipteronia dyeriana]